MFLQYSVCVPGAFAVLPSSNTIILCCRMRFLVASSPEEAFSCTFEVKLSPFPLIFQYCVNCRKIPSSLCAHPLAWDALLSPGCSFPLQCRVAHQGRTGLIFPPLSIWSLLLRGTQHKFGMSKSDVLIHSEKHRFLVVGLFVFCCCCLFFSYCLFCLLVWFGFFKYAYT